MTPKQIEKALRRQADEFEMKCQNGTLLNDSIKFHEFAAKWLEDYASKELRTKTYERYVAMLPRINKAIGNLKLSDIKTLHLHSLCKSLGEDGARHDIKHKCAVDFRAL